MLIQHLCPLYSLVKALRNMATVFDGLLVPGVRYIGYSGDWDRKGRLKLIMYVNLRLSNVYLYFVLMICKFEQLAAVKPSSPRVVRCSFSILLSRRSPAPS